MVSRDNERRDGLAVRRNVAHMALDMPGLPLEERVLLRLGEATLSMNCPWLSRLPSARIPVPAALVDWPATSGPGSIRQ